jgi:toxin ParE1/3/4
MVKVIWTKRAFGQLERVIRYTKEEQGLSYAEAVLNRILKSSELLKSMPKMGRVERLLEYKKSE